MSNRSRIPRFAHAVNASWASLKCSRLGSPICDYPSTAGLKQETGSVRQGASSEDRVEVMGCQVSSFL